MKQLINSVHFVFPMTPVWSYEPLFKDVICSANSDSSLGSSLGITFRWLPGGVTLSLFSGRLWVGEKAPVIYSTKAAVFDGWEESVFTWTSGVPRVSWGAACWIQHVLIQDIKSRSLLTHTLQHQLIWCCGQWVRFPAHREQRTNIARIQSKLSLAIDFCGHWNSCFLATENRLYIVHSKAFGLK